MAAPLPSWECDCGIENNTGKCKNKQCRLIAPSWWSAEVAKSRLNRGLTRIGKDMGNVLNLATTTLEQISQELHAHEDAQAHARLSFDNASAQAEASSRPATQQDETAGELIMAEETITRAQLDEVIDLFTNALDKANGQIEALQKRCTEMENEINRQRGRRPIELANELQPRVAEEIFRRLGLPAMIAEAKNAGAAPPPPKPEATPAPAKPTESPKADTMERLKKLAGR